MLHGILTTDFVGTQQIALRNECEGRGGLVNYWEKGERGKREYPRLLTRYHLPLSGLTANGQEKQTVARARKPGPGSLVTITCDNRCVIPSRAWHPPRAAA